MCRCPLPSTGSLGSVPPFPRYYKALRRPAAPPASLRFLRFAVPSLHLGLRSRGRKAPRPRAWGYSPDSPQPVSSTETTGPPRFLEDLTMNVPCSPTPAGPLRSATAALWCCLPPNGRRRLPRQILISGLNHTARSLAVYASQGGLLHRHARLASGWLAILSGRGWLPAGSQRKVSDLLILLSQASPGAPISAYRMEPFLNSEIRLFRKALSPPYNCQTLVINTDLAPIYDSVIPDIKNELFSTVVGTDPSKI
jgi:hypothetical protein